MKRIWITGGLLGVVVGLLVLHVPIAFAGTVSSAASQTFAKSQDPVAISTITVTEDAGEDMTTANDIRIRIPSTFNMTWDSSDTSVTLTDTTGNAVASGGLESCVASPCTATVSYESSNKILVIEVSNDANVVSTDAFTISGLSFASFTDASASDNLELCVDGSCSAVEATDDKTIGVGAATVLLRDGNKIFKVGDSQTDLPIRVTNGAVNVLKAGSDIRIKLPSGFPGQWFQSSTVELSNVAGTPVANMSNSVTYEDDAKTVVIDVTSDLTANDSFNIGELSVVNVETTFPATGIRIEVANDNTITATSSETLEVLKKSTVEVDTTPPGTPTNLTAEATAENHVKITWTDPADSDLDQIALWRSEGNTQISGEAYQFINTGVQEYIDQDISLNTTYNYLVQAHDTSANIGVASGQISIIIEGEEPVEEGPVEEEAEEGTPTVHTVEINSLQTGFRPSPLTIVVGEIVEWSNTNSNSHKIVEDNGVFLSETLYQGQTYRRTFDTVGTYNYHSDLFPILVGKIIVIEALAEEVSSGEESTGDTEGSEEGTDADGGEPSESDGTSTGQSEDDKAAPAKVNDVPEDHWAKGAIDKVRAAGLMVAKKPGEFRLADKMTRAEAATVIAKALGSGVLSTDDVASTMPFDDVAGDAWYAPYVSFVWEMGIVETQDKYNPGRLVNRAELFIMILKAKGINTETETITDHFADIPGGTWFDKIASIAYDRGLAMGKPRADVFYFAGGDEVTRAEAAVMLTKAFLQ